MTAKRNSDARRPPSTNAASPGPAAGRRISVIGLGYVGLPVAVAFARAGAVVVGYDIDSSRVAELRQGRDRTGEVPAGELAQRRIAFTADASALRAADFHIVAAPTPISAAHIPDLSALRAATTTLAAQLKRDDIVVYESTVYPGATEEECAPLLQAGSGLTAGRDFGLAYSPERINPGDRQHRFETIAKVVAATDPATLETVAQVYGAVVQATIHRAPSIRAAEAAKLIENTQRDLNIALMNEFAMICARLGLDSGDVLAAAATKWNFLPFSPGLVGGHCVGVDPYYLTFCAERAGYHPEVILAGRRINDGMGAWVARETIVQLMAAPRAAAGDGTRGPFRIAVLGLAFKEDVPDVRNSRVADLVRECQRFGCITAVHDPLAEAADARAQHGIALQPLSDLAPADAVILAVPHRCYREAGWPLIQGLLRDGQGVVTDVRGCLDHDTRPDGIHLWRI